jgi:LAO/AO transport system kinase
LRLVRGGSGWTPPVLTCSGLTGDGVQEIWQQVLRHRAALGQDGLATKRSAQRWELTMALVRDELDQRLRRSPAVAAVAADLRAEVLADHTPAPAAADAILRAFDNA